MQRVEVLLTARDNISPNLANIKKNIMGLGNAPGGNTGQSGIFGATLFGNLGAQAIATGIQLVTQGIQSAGQAIAEASRTELSAITLSGTLATKLGLSFASAQRLAKETRKEISLMAAELPGSNEDYKRVFEQISPIVSDISGGDVEKFRKDSLELTRRYGVLFATSGADAGMGGMALASALGGTRGLGELMQIDGFQRNPVLVDNIKKGLKEVGGKDWKDLTTPQRLKILTDAAKKSLSEDTIKAFEGTLSSMVEQVKTSLFDQDVGLFGFMREISSKGGRSAYDSIKRSFSAIIGLFEVLGNIGANLGLSFDPMGAFVGIVDWVTDLVFAFTGILNGASPDMITNIFDQAVGGISDFINGSITGLINLVEKIDWGMVGAALGRLVISNLKIINNIDWFALARLLINLVFVAPVDILVGFIEMLMNELGQYLIGLFNQLKDNINGILNPGNKPGGASVKSIAAEAAVKTLPFGLGWAADLLSPLFGLGRNNSAPLTAPATPSTNNAAFSPQVSVQAANSNPQVIAESVITALNQQYRQYQSNAIA